MRPGAILAVAVVLACGPWARADTVRTTGGIGVNGTILDLDADGVVIQVETTKRVIPLAEVSKIEAPKLPDLTKAEGSLARARLGGATAAQDFAAAERLYQGLMKDTGPAWVRVLAQWRMGQVYADSGRVATALDAFLGVAKAQPKLAAKMQLPKPREGDKANADMLAKVEEALKTAGNQPYAAELKAFAEALEVMESTGEKALPALEKMRKSDDPKTRDWAAARQMDILLGVGKVDEAEKLFTEMARDWTDKSPADVAFWKGRILQQQKAHLSAALELMRIPILYPSADKNRMAEALWRAGQAMEAGKSPAAEVTKVYQEAARYQGTAGAERARKDLARLSGGAK